MRTYIVKRLLLMVPNLIGITLVTFFLIRLAPGDPSSQIKGGAAAGQQAGKTPNKEIVEKWRQSRGLDKPVYVQYGIWLKNLVRLDFGQEFASTREDVFKKVSHHAQATIWLNVVSILVIYSVAIPIGMFSAARQYSYLDRIVTLGLFILYSLPSFWTATIALNLFCGDREASWLWVFTPLVLTLPLGIYLAWGSPGLARKAFAVLGVGLAIPAVVCLAMAWVMFCGQKIDVLRDNRQLAFNDTLLRFPVIASETHDEHLYERHPEGGADLTRPRLPWHEHAAHRAWHLFLPLMCLTYSGFAFISRQMRAGMLENIRQDYIRTARAKGLSEAKVVLKHALRNSLIPIVTLLGTLLPALLGGSVILERIFSLRGVGWLDLEAIFTREYNTIMGVTTLVAILTLIGIMISDIIYVLVNPRISLE